MSSLYLYLYLYLGCDNPVSQNAIKLEVCAPSSFTDNVKYVIVEAGKRGIQFNNILRRVKLLLFHSNDASIPNTSFLGSMHRCM